MPARSGITQSVSLTLVSGWEYEDGREYLRVLTNQPIGVNTLIEKSFSILLRGRRDHEQPG